MARRIAKHGHYTKKTFLNAECVHTARPFKYGSATSVRVQDASSAYEPRARRVHHIRHWTRTDDTLLECSRRRRLNAFKTRCANETAKRRVQRSKLRPFTKPTFRLGNGVEKVKFPNLFPDTVDVSSCAFLARSVVAYIWPWRRLQDEINTQYAGGVCRRVLGHRLRVRSTTTRRALANVCTLVSRRGSRAREPVRNVETCLWRIRIFNTYSCTASAAAVVISIFPCPSPLPLHRHYLFVTQRPSVRFYTVFRLEPTKTFFEFKIKKPINTAARLVSPVHVIPP